MSNFTRDALARTLKEMIKTRPLEKITVTDLAEKCQVNRQTFYYHFRDIYELVDWIIEEDFLNKIEQVIEYDSLSQRVKQVSDYVDEHKAFCLNVYRSVGKEKAERYLNSQIEKWLLSFLFFSSSEEYEEYNEVQLKFYVFGLTGLFTDWLEEKVDISTENLCGQLIYIVKSELIEK
ncbi:TetR/AcrR family transcriptional regulator C-terminal domain-containing protein [Vagococcus zengguangii]|uniref:TetR family transcriptional regulator n=1 Tax=Vagococcus zengguangii TaxID=2571750 RepID=A0A4D7CSS4_9ENTE|nr:TetR/AcrR family transcriptional regulator C-terminal domain-containing protein [Vagococcus zengguangii]QCI85772.1 TetR family transcriptional regulator [Vagococcus zengguangii]TLG81713.1 TetR family transcriptional regulator [Vagococcus zengguangii]